MREAKYRVWLKNGKCMEDVVEINFYDKTISYIEDDYINTEQRWIEEAFENIVLMQSTGLHDKNGTEIYEGDICNCEEYECFAKVEWNDDEAGFFFCVVIEGGGFEEERLYECVDELEIIGNIYDNPELLESEGN